MRWQKCGTLHDFACHPCAGAMLIFSVSFQMTAHSSLRAAYNTQQRRWRREFCAANTFCSATRWKWYPRDVCRVGGGEACVVPYMGGNWAPDYVGLIASQPGPESTNMCFILTDGCQMADICPWESTVYIAYLLSICVRTSLGHLLHILQNLASLLHTF